MLDTLMAQAYINHDRWVADCPRKYCTNAVQLEPRQTTFHCEGGCNLVTPIEWPADADELWEALQQRPVPATRNWAPPGHRQALVTGFPEGQTVDDLIAETHEFQECR